MAGEDRDADSAVDEVGGTRVLVQIEPLPEEESTFDADMGVECIVSVRVEDSLDDVELEDWPLACRELSDDPRERLDLVVPGSRCFSPGVPEGFNALCKGGLTGFADERDGGAGRGDTVRPYIGSTEGDDFGNGMAGDFAGGWDRSDPAEELRPARTKVARDVRVELLPLPCFDLV